MSQPSESGLVLVVGSANMDMVVTCEEFPQPGETILGNEFGMYPGGKGANQAVACGKLGGRVQFLGKMGEDVFRDRLVDTLKSAGVGLDYLQIDRKAPTGVALITVDASAQNEIVVVSGSNMLLRPADLAPAEPLFREARVVLVQLEIPDEAVESAARMARGFGATVILNPAPARTLSRGLLSSVSVLTPNESEAERLTGIEVTDRKSARAAGEALLAAGVGAVVLTQGAGGASLITAEGLYHFDAFGVEPVDTTAAGDAFSGALAFGLARGDTMPDAIRFAGAVAALSVTRRGAQPSMPDLKEVNEFLADRATEALPALSGMP